MFTTIALTTTVGLLMVIRLLWLSRRPPILWSNNACQETHQRKLGFQERIFAEIGKMGLGQMSPIAFFRSKLPLNEDTMKEALSALAKKHQLLRMRLGKEDGLFKYMKEMENFKVDLQVYETSDWKQLLEDQLLEVLDSEKGPLWRVKFIPNTTYDDGTHDGYPYQAACIFTFHHAILDGLAYSKIYNELLDNLHDILAGKKLVFKPLPLLQPVEAYLELNDNYSLTKNIKINMISLLFSIPLLRAVFLAKPFQNTPLLTKVFGDEFTRNPKDAFKTCVLATELTSKQTSQLITVCKKHNVSVNSAVQTACSVAYCTIADGGKLKQIHTLKVSNAHSLHQVIPSQFTQHLGLFVSRIHVDITVGPKLKFWNIARTVKKTTDDKIANVKSSMIQTIRLSNYVKPNLQFSGKRINDLAIANYGNQSFLNRETASNVKLTARFDCGAQVQTGPVFYNSIATCSGKLFWTVVYATSATNKDQAQKYASLAKQFLLSAIEMGRPL